MVHMSLQVSLTSFERLEAAGVDEAVLPIIGGALTGIAAVAYPEILYQGFSNVNAILQVPIQDMTQMLHRCSISSSRTRPPACGCTECQTPWIYSSGSAIQLISEEIVRLPKCHGSIESKRIAAPATSCSRGTRDGMCGLPCRVAATSRRHCCCRY